MEISQYDEMLDGQSVHGMVVMQAGEWVHLMLLAIPDLSLQDSINIRPSQRQQGMDSLSVI
jgi:hypothetical protein